MSCNNWITPIKHSEQPKPLHEDVLGVYHESCLSEPNDLEQRILYPTTHVTYTDWGSRSLTKSEFADAFDLPLWCPWNAAITVLIKICLEILQGFLVQHATELPEAANILTVKSVPSIPKHTWLASLQCFLPGSLAVPALISVKAAKADDAKVPTSMWNDRITLVRPHWTPSQFDLMHRLLFCRQCHRLYLEFIGYMAQRYGHQWLTTLMRMRCSTWSASRSFCSPSVHEQKRVKGGGR
jgi:hypothetical protein